MVRVKYMQDSNTLCCVLSVRRTFFSVQRNAVLFKLPLPVACNNCDYAASVFSFRFFVLMIPGIVHVTHYMRTALRRYLRPTSLIAVSLTKKKHRKSICQYTQAVNYLYTSLRPPFPAAVSLVYNAPSFSPFPSRHRISISH